MKNWVPVQVPLCLPVWMRDRLVRAKRRLDGEACNLLGDRDVEWGFVAAHMPAGPGKALDFGPGGSCLGLVAAERGFSVTAFDREPVEWFYRHPDLAFTRGDILHPDPRWKEKFDLVINCSSVEHVGLAGRYGVKEPVPDGDIRAMAHLRDMMKSGARMLITVPAGEDALFPPLCRVYGRERLHKLLFGYRVEKQQYWIKDTGNRWVLSDEKLALAVKARMGSWDVEKNICALGCFVLKK